MRILFACDLDNTLLYSYRHKREGDVCVEILKDKEQGFMSRKACELLKKARTAVSLVPVTTRSVEQYSRIKWEEPPEYAVTTNGAVLLNNYIKDNDWCGKSSEYSGSVYDEMIRLRDIFLEQDRFIRCRIVDDMYLFVYCKEEADVKRCIDEYSALLRLDVTASGKKIYFFPREINKGTAIMRLKEKFAPHTVICAGDSEIDIPMLDAADIAVVPSEAMAEKISHKNIYINNEDNFSEFVLKTVINQTCSR